ncbi:alpha/beta hydrolase family protein [Amycolatopsis nigrescens]|uniref:alpha/beta hydrolase family protein n=1 Tax=Amycolatopsis nigrescens TaxID=381445 RepID=UPI0003A25785|nr:alpha/beta fold hydrolase [Amycolatopsis nigrescens]
MELPAELAATGAAGYRIRYPSTTTSNFPTTVTGFVLVPPGTPPRGGGWPVISWAHGTTGVGDRCAPSRDPELGGYGYPGYLAKFVRAGYAVTATDYEGLGSPGVHPYLIAESAGRSVVDAVHAARRLAPRLSASWFAVGHSQGGHAALAAAERASHGLDFRGAVALAPVTDNRAYADGDVKPVDHAYFLALLTGLDTQHPPLRYSDYLGPRALRELPRLHTTCLDELTDRMIGLALPGGEFTPRTPGAAGRLRDRLAGNAVPRHRSAPVLITQGDADTLVPPEQTERAAAQARAFGTDATLLRYPGAGHYDITETSAPDVLRWIDERLREARFRG